MDAVRLAAVGVLLLVAAIGAMLAGVLPAEAAGATLARIWPVLLFVTAITLVAEIAALAGVFTAVASRLTRLSRGRVALLWAFIVVLAVLTTAFLSLDTTAVLLTPIVVAVARASGIPPLPFALTTVWLANTGSLFLPVSNLTNLLAEARLPGGPGAFFALLWPSAVLAVAVPALVLWLLHRRALSGSFTPPPSPPPRDAVLFRVSAVVLVVLLPLLVSGTPPWMPALGAALVLVVATALRAPRTLRISMLPLGLIVFAVGLFLTVTALRQLGLDSVLAAVAAPGDALPALWQVAAAGALGANLVDNLPAYLALEPIADSPARLAALLIGVNAGPLITPWASLATLLWHDRLTAAGIRVSWGRYALWGLLAAPLTVFVATLPLARFA